MIALFSEPIECEWINGYTKEGGANLIQCLLLGLIRSANPEVDDQAVIVVSDGTLRWVDAADIVTKWRYDEQEQDWIDHSGPDIEPEPEE